MNSHNGSKLLSDKEFNLQRFYLFVAVLIFSCGFILLIVRGILPSAGLLNPNIRLIDLNHFYSAGTCWNIGQNPYDHKLYSKIHEEVAGGPTSAQFYYPPQIIPWFGLLASLNYAKARLIITIINVLSVFGITLMTIRVAMFQGQHYSECRKIIPWVIGGIILGAPMIAHLIILGQVVLPVVALVFSGWHLSRKGNDFFSGILLGMATAKPQYVILIFLWLMLERRWIVIGTATGLSVLMALPVFLSFGTLNSIHGWLNAISLYESGSSGGNLLGHYLVMGFPSLLAAIGLPVPGSFIFMIFGVFILAVLWWFRHLFCKEDILGIILGMHCILIYAKYVEMILAIPLLVSLWLHIGHKRKALFFWIGTFFVLFFPTRILIQSEMTYLHHIKSVLLLAILGFLLVMSMKKRKLP